MLEQRRRREFLTSNDPKRESWGTGPAGNSEAIPWCALAGTTGRWQRGGLSPPALCVAPLGRVLPSRRRQNAALRGSGQAATRVALQLEKAGHLRRMRRYALEMCDELRPATFLEMFGKPAVSWPTVTIQQLAESRANAIRTGPFGSQLLHSEFTSGGVAVLGIDNAVNNRFDWAQRRYISADKYGSLGVTPCILET
jgi:hypothetical protein